MFFHLFCCLSGFCLCSCLFHQNYDKICLLGTFLLWLPEIETSACHHCEAICLFFLFCCSCSCHLCQFLDHLLHFHQHWNSMHFYNHNVLLGLINFPSNYLILLVVSGHVFYNIYHLIGYCNSNCFCDSIFCVPQAVEHLNSCGIGSYQMWFGQIGWQHQDLCTVYHE